MRPQRYIDRRGRIKKALSQLDDLILLADSSKQDIVLTGHLTNFSVLRISGTLEYCVSEAIKLHLDRCSDPEIARFVESSTVRLMNLDAEKLERLLARFSERWAEAVRAYLEIDENRQQLNSLIGTRNTLAHGGSSQVRLDTIYRYKALLEDLINLIVDLLDPKKASNSPLP